MMNLRKFSAILLASAFIPANINVDGLGATNATKEMAKNSSKTLTSANSVCGQKPCLPLCCPLGKALVYGSCLEDNVTSGILPENLKEDNFEFFNYDPCLFGWMGSSFLDHFNLLRDGSISVADSDGESIFDSEHFCLFRDARSAEYLAKVCQPWIKTTYWQIACTIFSCVVMLLIIICYSIVPELDNLHGLVFRAYLATYLFTHVALIGQQLTTRSKNYAHVFTFFVFCLHYSAGCCALWLNVMSFNIWRTFRGLRPIDSNIREQERKKFVWYAIYAWVTPALLYLIIIAIMAYVPYYRQVSLNKSLILWCCAALLTSIVVVNTFLYTSTALKIKQHQKDTSYIKNGVNKHNDMDKQWFNLHVKLFLVTGVHTIMWVIWELWPISINTNIMIVLEIIQSISIFVIFVWKDNVRRSIRKRFDDTLGRLHNTFGPGIGSSTTPTTKA